MVISILYIIVECILNRISYIWNGIKGRQILNLKDDNVYLISSEIHSCPMNFITNELENLKFCISRSNNFTRR